MHFKIFLALFIAAGIFTGCQDEDQILQPEDKFTRIYDSRIFDDSYLPVDVKENSNGEFLILSGRRKENTGALGIVLLKTDNTGTLEELYELGDPYVNPTRMVEASDSLFYFFCMDEATLTVYLASVDPANGIISDPDGVGLSYPLAASRGIGDQLLLLSYDHVDKETVISEVGMDASIQGSQRYTIGANNDNEEQIIDHFTREGQRLPFQVGRSSDIYFFNGFYNFTFSMVFVDMQGGNNTGVLQGQQYDAGVSAAMHIDGQNYALATFNFNRRYIQPRVTIDANALSSTIDIENNPIPELGIEDNPEINTISIDQVPYTVFAANTRNSQIVLYFYSQENGDLRGTRYLGFNQPYHFEAMTPTNDGGLAITGSVFVAGRFQRVLLIKLAVQDLRSIIN